jgi:hypothetical protein
METTPHLSDYEEKAINKFCQSFYEGKWSEDGLVALWKLIGEDFLSLVSVAEYAKETCITPQGVRKSLKIKIHDFKGRKLVSNSSNT